MTVPNHSTLTWIPCTLTMIIYTGLLTFLHLNTLLFQELTQALNLFLQLTDELSISVFIDNSVAADLFGAVSIPVEVKGKLECIP